MMNQISSTQPLKGGRSIEWPTPSPAMISICSCIAVMLCVGIAFQEVLTAGLANQDDHHYLLEVGRIWRTSWTEAANVFTEARPAWPPSWENVTDLATEARIHRPSNTGGYYQPLVALSFMLDAFLTKVSNSRTFQFHFSNLILHLIDTMLIFALVRRFSKSHLWPILLALIFGLHPIQVESVAWISQRMTLLGTCFALLSLHAYVRYVVNLRWGWFVAAAVCYAAALLCRPLFIGLPVIFLLLDLWPFGRQATGAPSPDARLSAGSNAPQINTQITLRPIWEKAPLFVLMIVAASVQFAIRPTEASHGDASAGGAFQVLHQFAALIARLFIPLRLSPYQPPGATVGAVALGPGFDWAVCVVVVAVLCLTFRSKPQMFVALAGAVLLIAPGLMELPYTNQLLGDQYLYAALIVPILVFASWLGTRERLFQTQWGRLTAIAMASLIPIYGVLAYGQTQNWQNPHSLYERTAKLYPDWAFGHIGLVEELISAREIDNALIKAKEAVGIAPDDPTTQFYLGTVLLLHEDGLSREAIAPLRKALASNASWIQCLQNLGVALARSGDVPEAITYLEKARDLQPHVPGVRVGLGNAYLKVERFASARKEFQEALKWRNDSVAHLGLAIAWAANDAPEYARRHLAAAVAKDPSVAQRASRSRHLQQLRELPGFEHLLPIGGQDPDAGVSAIESPPALRAHGS